MRLVLFVCVSNTCRSPICEYLLRSKLSELNLAEEYVVESRSLSEDYEPQGSPANEMGREVMQKEYGIDTSAHRSRLLSAQDVQRAWMIVPVKRDLGAHLADAFPSAIPKIRPLQADVADPWRQPYEVYAQCAGRVVLLLQELLRDLEVARTTV
ncbi:phosphotyrosine protein phosphatase I superfamily [Ochromonadaceae sp. CCMP2298]|nr:phosphotyrosine protein phosphatase I superfamily [Ochromonadaceae sp. CCMP2298]